MLPVKVTAKVWFGSVRVAEYAHDSNVYVSSTVVVPWSAFDVAVPFTCADPPSGHGAIWSCMPTGLPCSATLYMSLIAFLTAKTAAPSMHARSHGGVGGGPFPGLPEHEQERPSTAKTATRSMRHGFTSESSFDPDAGDRDRTDEGLAAALQGAARAD